VALWLPQANVKARDETALGRFWADALGWTLDSEAPGVTNVAAPGVVWPDPTAFGLDVVRVPDPETVRYRVHLHLATTSTAHHAELVERLVKLGATPEGPGALADPEGNVFRVLEPQEADRDTGPIAAVVVDCTDPAAQAGFWGEALGWEGGTRLRPPGDAGPYLEFARGDDSPSRIHIDVAPYPGDDQAAEVARLLALGATPADVGQGDVPWKVLADPEGNQFCVLRPA